MILYENEYDKMDVLLICKIRRGEVELEVERFGRKKDPRSCYTCNSGNLGSLKEDGICGGLSLARIAGKRPD